MDRILLKNGRIYDGTGNPGFAGDILLEGERIRKIGTNLAEDIDRVMDVKGKIICPGFVDIHRHCDAKPFLDPDFGRRELAQGITTTVVGNCGISLTPAPREDRQARAMYDFDEAVLGKLELNLPRTYESYVRELQKTPLPLNMASQIGIGSLRISMKGFSQEPFTKEELDRARTMVDEALEGGALGASIGIMYVPECYFTVREYAYILKPLGERGRLLTAHIRGEGDSLVKSVREVIEIAEKAGCALEISHFKSCGIDNWKKDIHEAIALIEEARRSGQDVSCDFYPYDGGSTALTTMLPPAFIQGDMEKALKRLGTPEGVEEFRISSRKRYPDWDNYCVTLGWDRILISAVQNDELEKMVGMTVKEAAEEFGYRDPEELAAYLMYADRGKTAIINKSMCQEDIDTVARLSYSSIISDAIYADTPHPHPRLNGAFPKVIREYVRERCVLSMEEAVRKMTGQPAKRFGIRDRGLLKEGYFADILVFDPAEFRDCATYEKSGRQAKGISYLLVNGQIAVENDRWTKKYAGTCISADKEEKHE